MVSSLSLIMSGLVITLLTDFLSRYNFCLKDSPLYNKMLQKSKETKTKKIQFSRTVLTMGIRYVSSFPELP